MDQSDLARAEHEVPHEECCEERREQQRKPQRGRDIASRPQRRTRPWHRSQHSSDHRCAAFLPPENSTQIRFTLRSTARRSAAVSASSTGMQPATIGTAGPAGHGKRPRWCAPCPGFPRAEATHPPEPTVDLGFGYHEIAGRRFGVVDLPGTSRLVRGSSRTCTASTSSSWWSRPMPGSYRRPGSASTSCTCSTRATSSS